MIEAVSIGNAVTVELQVKERDKARERESLCVCERENERDREKKCGCETDKERERMMCER